MTGADGGQLRSRISMTQGSSTPTVSAKNVPGRFIPSISTAVTNHVTTAL